MHQTGTGTTRIDSEGALARLDPLTGPGGRMHKVRVAPGRALQPEDFAEVDAQLMPPE